MSKPLKPAARWAAETALAAVRADGVGVARGVGTMGARDGSSTSQGGVAVAVGQGETVPESTAAGLQSAHTLVCAPRAEVVVVRNCDLELQVQTSKRQRPAAVCKEGECTGRGGVWLRPGDHSPKVVEAAKIGTVPLREDRRTKGARSGNRVGGQLLDDFFKSKRFKQAMVAAVFLLAGIIGCIVWRWDWLSGGEQGNTPSETLRNMGLLIAGVLALAFALWRAWVAEKQSVTARQQADTAQQGLLYDRYQRGAQMLGDKILAVRMAGIYSLQHLAAEDPEEYHIQIMQLFSAFVRNPTRHDDHRVLHLIEGPQVPGLREDVQAVLDVINERRQDLTTWGRYASNFELNFSGADLRGAMLADYDLSNALLVNVDLSGATVEGACLHSAQLYGATMKGTVLIGADLSGAQLQHSDLAGAFLSTANFASASLYSANLTGAVLMNANLEDSFLPHAIFSDAYLLNTNLSGANFSGPQGLVEVNSSNHGLTQTQLDDARSDPNNPPSLGNLCDVDTHEPLIWRGHSLDEPLRIR